LAELGVSPGKAYFQALDFAVPSFALGLGNAVDQVAADLSDPRPLGRGWPQEWASQAGLTEMILSWNASFWDAWCDSQSRKNLDGA
jgi:hypothetical protein